LGTGGWGYVKEATFRGRRGAAKYLHEAIVPPYNQDLFAKQPDVVIKTLWSLSELFQVILPS